MSDYGISKYAPALAKKPAKVQEVVKFLEEVMGVPDECSLEDVTMEDLMGNGLLKKGAARKLTEAWQNKGKPESTPPAASASGISIQAKTIGKSEVAAHDINKTVYGDETFDLRTFGGDSVQGSKKETTYYGSVNKSQQNVTYGDHAQVGGTRSSTKVKLTDNAKMEAKQLKIGHGDQNITNAPETLSTDDHFFHDDPDYNFIDPKSVKVTPVPEEVYRSHFSQNDVYPIRPWKRNQALIINIIKVPNQFRDGADKDSIRLRTLLNQLGFNVTVEENLSKADIGTCIDNFLSSDEIEIAPVVLLYIGSHGGRAYNQDYFLSADNQWVSIPDVVKKFRDPKYETSLAGKPKVFWFQFCRKDITQKDSILPEAPDMDVTEMHETFKPQSLIDWFNLQSVSKDGEFGRSLSDMFVACATVPGSFALRDNQVGSWFVYAIALVFSNHACSQSLRSLFTKVNEAIGKRGKETKEPVNVAGEPCCTFGERSLYFYPH